jgi:DNA-binding response OmpR family regulator
MDAGQVPALHRQHDFDLILLDLHVPVVDGFQVTAALLPGDDEDYFPVVVLTSQPVSKRRARQAGWGRDGRQPFDLEQLKARIHSTLEVRLLFRCLEVHNGRTARTARAPEQAARLIGLAASD